MTPVLIDRRGRHPEFDGPGARITDLAELAAALETLERGASLHPGEANAALPGLRQLLPRLREARRALIAVEPTRSARPSRRDGGGVAGSDWFEAAADPQGRT